MRRALIRVIVFSLRTLYFYDFDSDVYRVGTRLSWQTRDRGPEPYRREPVPGPKPFGIAGTGTGPKPLFGYSKNWTRNRYFRFLKEPKPKNHKGPSPCGHDICVHVTIYDSNFQTTRYERIRGRVHNVYSVGISTA